MAGKQYTEADLKKIDKDGLVVIADKLGIDYNNINKTSVPTIITDILKAQADAEEKPEPDEESATSKTAAAPDKTAEDSPKAESDKKKTAPSISRSDESKLISVRSTKREERVSGGYEQVFRERHPAHPGGQAWIANHKVHQVAKTQAVKRAILDGILEEV